MVTGRMQRHEYTTDYDGYEITAAVTKLDYGYHVLLTGGSRTHVGSVSSAGYDNDISHQFTGHRDEVVSKMWADALHEISGEPVVVCCGIHYDGVNKEQINAIVDACGRLLEDVKKDLKISDNT